MFQIAGTEGTRGAVYDSPHKRPGVGGKVLQLEGRESGHRGRLHREAIATLRLLQTSLRQTDSIHTVREVMHGNAAGGRKMSTAKMYLELVQPAQCVDCRGIRRRDLAPGNTAETGQR